MTYQLYRGKILVATPTLSTDEIFKESVVYIYEEKDEQIYGLVLNKPSSLKVTDAVKLKNSTQEPEVIIDQPIYKGGPVSDQTLVLLHSNEWQSTNTYQLPHDLALSSDELMIQKVMMGNVPKNYKMLAGVSTWHPRQLAMEIHHGSWLQIENPNPKLFWNADGKAGWMDAVKNASNEAVADFF